jgi:hypothetical protein
MAAAIIPLVLDAAPLITPLLQKSIIGVEHLFHFKPKHGPAKSAIVNSFAKTLCDSLVAAGVLKSAPEGTELNTLIQTIYNSLDVQGIMNNPTATAIAATTSVLPSVHTTLQVSGTLNLG